MKFLHILSLLLMALVAYTSAQRCNPTCFGNRDVGQGGRNCVPRTMWHYDARIRQCREMRYLGCGGNNNLWCTRAACDRSCRRR
ncbi:kunitz-type serine protease inhibitor homolog beta-bungarotoxin B1 chain, major component-like [Calliphora vicina]|uniref:kunitz-type serine protease inhibitor homolog beta-bungarotoxin B1 chain, major component-like n=1 Tax=Calliphora vicina TaxID=7373 RepID=UPI00325A9277